MNLYKEAKGRAMGKEKKESQRKIVKGPMATAAEQRPANFPQLSAEEQWAIDKSLGILDWNGDPRS